MLMGCNWLKRVRFRFLGREGGRQAWATDTEMDKEVVVVVVLGKETSEDHHHHRSTTPTTFIKIHKWKGKKDSREHEK